MPDFIKIRESLSAIHGRDKTEEDATRASCKNKPKGWHSRGYLPHCDREKTLQFITFRLHDSVPQKLLDQWKTELMACKEWLTDKERFLKLHQRIERYIDQGLGSCYLRDERIARLVEHTLKYFHGSRYQLMAWCIMPNHVHVLIRMGDVSLSRIIHSWKSYTAREANKILNRCGPFWAIDYFDRFIRGERHFNYVIRYILNNPVKAGLVKDPGDWPWSGCWIRRSHEE